MNIINPNAKAGIILIPGVYGQLHKDKRFLKLSEYLKSQNVGAILPDVWENEDALEKLSLTDVFAILDKAFTLAKKQFKKVGAVGKSFGAGMLLAHPLKLDAMILWAPAISVGDENNIEKLKNTKLEKMEDVRDITITKENLAKITIPTLFIQGSKDTLISVDDAELLCYRMPNANIEVIDTDHSFSSNIDNLVSTTSDFLENKFRE